MQKEITIQLTLEQDDMLKLLPYANIKDSDRDELVKLCYNAVIELISKNRPHQYDHCPVCGKSAIVKDNLIPDDTGSEPQYFRQCYCTGCGATFDEDFAFLRYSNIQTDKGDD